MRLTGGLLVLAAVLVELGTGPVVDGLHATRPGPLLVAAAVTAVTTVCCAVRWRVVATALGARLELPAAVAAVYRAQFLNVTFPGGVLGDVDRAVGHGRHLGRLGTAVRSVVWERALGQVVQVALTAGVLVALSSPWRSLALVAGPLALLACALGAVVLQRSALVLDLRRVLGTPAGGGAVVAASLAAAAGHLLVFVVAARATGVHAPLSTLLPIAALVVLVSAVPLNVAGWGPREGMAAWAFAAAGLGAPTGLAVSVAYGVMATLATLPGGLVLLAGRGTWTVCAPAPTLEEAVRG